jgi:hypothetical protein
MIEPPNCHDQDGYWCCDDLKRPLTNRKGDSVQSEDVVAFIYVWNQGSLDCFDFPEGDSRSKASPNCHDKDGYWCCDDLKGEVTNRDGEEVNLKSCSSFLGPCTRSVLDCKDIPQWGKVTYLNHLSNPEEMSGRLTFWYFIMLLVIPIAWTFSIVICVCQCEDDGYGSVFVTMCLMFLQILIAASMPYWIQLILVLSELVFLVWGCTLDPRRTVKRERAEKHTIDRQGLITRLGAQAGNARDMDLIRWAYEELTPNGRDSVTTMTELDALIKRGRERRQKKQEQIEEDRKFH